MDKKGLKVIKGGAVKIPKGDVSVSVFTERPEWWGKPKNKEQKEIINNVQRAQNTILGRGHYEHLAPVPKKENK